MVAGIRRLKNDIKEIQKFLKSQVGKTKFEEMREAQAKQVCRITETKPTWSGLTEISDMLAASQVWTQEQLSSLEEAVSAIATSEEPQSGGLRRSRPPLRYVRTSRHISQSMMSASCRARTFKSVQRQMF